jgi:hypothetical protein
MSFLGNTPTTQSFTSLTERFNGNGSATTVTLSRAVYNASDIEVLVNNVQQDPYEAYTVNGTNTLTFTEAPSSGTGNIIVTYRNYTITKFVPGEDTVTTSTIANGTITGVKIASSAITGDKIGLTAITGNLIAATTITGDKIGLTAITSNLIAANAITTAAIADGAINTSELSAGAVTGDKIGLTAINANNIVDGTITGAKIASATITGDKIGLTAITGNLIASATITGDKIAVGQITSNLIAANAVTTAAIADGAVNTSELAAGAVTGDKIGLTAINANNIVNGSITNAKLATPGGGSWTYLSTVTAASSSTVDIETTIDSTYDNYAIVASNIVPSSSGAIPYFRMKVDGAYATGANDYPFALSMVTNATSTLGGDSAGTTQIRAGRELYTTTVAGDLECMAFVLYLFIPSNTTRAKSIIWQGGQYSGLNAATTSISGYGVINKTSAVTGVRFYFDSGTVSTGTFRLYGIKNS